MIWGLLNKEIVGWSESAEGKRREAADIPKQLQSALSTSDDVFVV